MFGTAACKDSLCRLAQSVGIALITAFAIGVTLDISFRTRLARDVFSEAFGYILPQEIRDEIKWVTSLDRIAISYEHDFFLKPHSTNRDLLVLEEAVKREIKNLSDGPIKVRPSVGVQEWFHHDFESEVLNLAYKHMSGKNELGSGSIADGKAEILSHLQGGHIRHARVKDELTVYPNESVIITWRTREAKSKNDAAYSFSGSAARNPSLSIEVDPALNVEYEVKFQSRHQGDLIELEGDRFELKGLLLPLQTVRVRWWDKGMKAEWEEARAAK